MSSWLSWDSDRIYLNFCGPHFITRLGQASEKGIGRDSLQGVLRQRNEKLARFSVESEPWGFAKRK